MARPSGIDPHLQPPPAPDLDGTKAGASCQCVICSGARIGFRSGGGYPVICHNGNILLSSADAHTGQRRIPLAPSELLALQAWAAANCSAPNNDMVGRLPKHLGWLESGITKGWGNTRCRWCGVALHPWMAPVTGDQWHGRDYVATELGLKRAAPSPPDGFKSIIGPKPPHGAACIKWMRSTPQPPPPSANEVAFESRLKEVARLAFLQGLPPWRLSSDPRILTVIPRFDLLPFDLSHASDDDAVLWDRLYGGQWDPSLNHYPI